MGNKSGGAEAVHKILVDIHFYVGDFFGDPIGFLN
jgi:hypothetical protein